MISADEIASGTKHTAGSLLIPKDADKSLFAAQYLEFLKASTVEHFPQALQEIVFNTQDAFLHFTEKSGHPLKDSFDEGMDNYVSPTCRHVLMLARMSGHKTIEDFLQAAAPGRFTTPESVLTYLKELSQQHDPSGMDAKELKAEFDDNLATQADSIKAFFDTEAVRLRDGTMLVHGVLTHLDETKSVGVNAKSYYKNFIAANPTLYHIPISTTASVDVAIEYSALTDLDLKNPLEVIDLRDESEEGLASRQAMQETVDGLGDELGNQALLHFFRTQDGRGVWLTHNEAEKEIFLTPEHVVLPTSVVRGENYFIFVADVVAISHAGTQAPVPFTTS